MASIYDWSATAASNATVGSINWAEGQAPSTINNSARDTMADVAKWRDILGGAKISSGTDTIVLTSGLSLSAYAQGMMIAFEAGGANSGAATLNIDSIGARAVVKRHDVALASGDIEAGQIVLVAYEATANNFQMLSQIAAAPTETPIGQHTIWVPASAMEAAVTTAAATSNAVEIGTSLFAARTMDFATGADDFCYFGIQMPKSWDAGTLVCQFVWSATGTTANTVLWAIAATSLGNDEVLTTAFPTPTSPAADTNSTTADDLMISAEVTVTVGSTPTAEDYVVFEVSRDVSGDTLAEDARLHGVRIHYTIDTGNDS